MQLVNYIISKKNRFAHILLIALSLQACREPKEKNSDADIQVMENAENSVMEAQKTDLSIDRIDEPVTDNDRHDLVDEPKSPKDMPGPADNPIELDPHDYHDSPSPTDRDLSDAPEPGHNDLVDMLNL